MTAVIIHLSDIHVRSGNDPILARGEDIARASYRYLPEASHVFVIVTGDIAYSGKAEEYEAASAFLGRIRSSIVTEFGGPVSILVVPGNHDCDFESESGARTALLRALDNPRDSEVDDHFVSVCTTVQNNFFDFREKIEDADRVSGDRLWRTARYVIEGREFLFECLNVSWTSRLQETPGLLYFPVDRFSEKGRDTPDIRVALLHHPLNWYAPAIYRQFRKELRKLSNIILSGHEHVANVGINIDSESEESAYIEGCVLQGEQDLSDSSFNIVVVDMGERQFSSTRFSWNQQQYLESEEGSWTDYRRLPGKKVTRFQITAEFEEALEDPGASLWHPGKVRIALSDIFVYPDLAKMADPGPVERATVSSRRLLSPEELTPGVIIAAEEKAGSTSLLFRLYREYHSRGFVPLYVSGRDIRRHQAKELEGVIRRAVRQQYGESAYADFDQASRTARVLLLDDFDECGVITPEARAGALDYLSKRFDRMVVTVSDMFELKELVESDVANWTSRAAHYQLQPFGYVRRGELIERWFSINADGGIDEATLVAKCDKAERLMTAVRARGLVPSLPLYLLTLLQGVEGGADREFQSTGLGHYYNFLLTGAFTRAGVPSEKLNEMYQYTSHLAWAFHKAGRSALSEQELRDFNEEFSRQWVTVEFSKQLKILLDSRVLNVTGSDYQFRYPYVYYFLKGHYLAESLEQPDVKAHVERCARHLYVRDNANTLLFLAHHKCDDYVLAAISSSLGALFADRQPVTLDGDTKAIAALIEDAPSLIYSGESPRDVRRRQNELQDSLDDGNDGLSTREETTDKLSVVAQMAMLARVTEILGQVLKNQYAKITRDRKVELLTQLFEGPLRGIKDFYLFLESDTAKLVAEVEAALSRNALIKNDDSRKRAARRIAAGLIDLVTFGFVMRAAQAANSESLLEDVQRTVREKGTTAFKMIELAVLLDSPRPIPRLKLSELSALTQKDTVASHLLRLLVLHRLYMFRTTERDMQWLKEELDIGLELQHRIGYQAKRNKQLK